MTDETERTENGVGDAGLDEAGVRDRGPGDGAEGEGVEGTASPGSDEVRSLRTELTALNDRHLRLAAEFDNYRKRNERERHAMVSRLQADLVAALLDVLDDLQRVEESGPDVSAQSVLDGVRLVEKKFLGVLEGAGLEPVDAEGAPFDPAVMEALMTVATDDPGKDHHVADVFQRGYRFRDTLLRPARVRVLQYEEPSDRAD